MKKPLNWFSQSFSTPLPLKVSQLSSILYPNAWHYSLSLYHGDSYYCLKSQLTSVAVTAIVEVIPRRIHMLVDSTNKTRAFFKTMKDLFIYLFIALGTFRVKGNIGQWNYPQPQVGSNKEFSKIWEIGGLTSNHHPW